MNILKDYRQRARRCLIADTEGRDFGPWFPFRRWFPILGIPVLCFLLGPSAEGQSSGKNVLFLFSSVQYSDETLNVIEPLIRARFPQVTFYHAYLDDPPSGTEILS